MPGARPRPRGLWPPSVGNEGWTAFMYAAEHGHATVVKLLLDRGGDPDAACTSDRVPANIQNPTGWSALMDAAQGGHLEVSK